MPTESNDVTYLTLQMSKYAFGPSERQTYPLSLSSFSSLSVSPPPITMIGPTSTIMMTPSSKAPYCFSLFLVSRHCHSLSSSLLTDPTPSPYCQQPPRTPICHPNQSPTLPELASILSSELSSFQHRCKYKCIDMYPHMRRIQYYLQ